MSEARGAHPADPAVEASLVATTAAGLAAGRFDPGSRPRACGLLLLALLALLVTALHAAGCGAPTGRAELELRAEGPERYLLRGQSRVATYMVGPSQTSVYVSDVPVERLVDGSARSAQIVHIELLWVPKPGRTPMDEQATNASIRYIVLAEGEAGIYGGAGFVLVKGKLDGRKVRLIVEDASMALLESTSGFRDRLSPANLEGEVIAVGSEEITRQIRQAVSQRVTDAFGETRIVDAWPARSWWACLWPACLPGPSEYTASFRPAGGASFVLPPRRRAADPSRGPASG